MRRRPTRDVIVVGAGPAGSTTALLLARQGRDVLLLDRAAFPRPKPCGDCLSAAATHLLRRHGLLGRVRAAGATAIEGWRVVAPDGTVAAGRLGDPPALALDRERLDRALLEAAVEAGAEFRRAHVTDLLFEEENGGRVRGVVVRAPGPAGSSASSRDTVLTARLVVAADGLRSVVARRLNRVRRNPRLSKLSLTAHLPGGGLSHGEMHVLDGGCTGYAPAGRGRRNLTVVVGAEQGRSLTEEGPAAFFRDRLASAPGLRDRLDHELAAVADLHDTDLLASGPFDWPSRGPVDRGVALVGDAAGYYDPFTGQGIHQAIAGATLLAEAVAPALASDGPVDRLDRALRRYARRKRRLTRPARRLQWLIEQALARPAVADRALARLASAPHAMDRLLAVTGDLAPPRSLLSPAVVSSFLFPPTGGSIGSDR